jgi:hypothetical protein
MQSDRKLRHVGYGQPASEGKNLLKEPAGGEKLRQGLAVLIAGEPVLTTVGGMDLRIVPLQVVRRRLPAASRRAQQVFGICW